MERVHASKVALAVLLPALLAVALALPQPALAGMVITEQEYASDDAELKTTSSTLVQKNRLRIQEQDDIIYYLWNLESGEFFQVNTEAKVYTGGPFEAEMAGLKRYLGKVKEQMIQELKDMGEDITPPAGDAPRTKPVVIVSKTDQTADIAGYKAVKYDVRQNDTLVEELWLSQELGKELDYAKFKRLSQSWTTTINEAFADPLDEMEDEWYATEEYLKIFADGFALKQVETYPDGSYISEVVKIEKKDLPESDFQVPADFKKLSPEEFMERGEE